MAGSAELNISLAPILSLPTPMPSWEWNRSLSDICDKAGDIEGDGLQMEPNLCTTAEIEPRAAYFVVECPYILRTHLFALSIKSARGSGNDDGGGIVQHAKDSFHAGRAVAWQVTAVRGRVLFRCCAIAWLPHANRLRDMAARNSCAWKWRHHPRQGALSFCWLWRRAFRHCIDLRHLIVWRLSSSRAVCVHFQHDRLRISCCAALFFQKVPEHLQWMGLSRERVVEREWWKGWGWGVGRTFSVCVWLSIFVVIWLFDFF